MSGAAGVAHYVFMQDGASARTAKAIEPERAELFPSLFEKKGWAANIKDLAVLDFFIRLCAQRKVNERKPQTLRDLKLAIGRAFSAAPLAMVQSAIDSFCERYALCVAEGGRTPNHSLKSRTARDIETPPRGMRSGEPGRPEIPDEPINGFECEQGGPNEPPLEGGSEEDA